MAVIKAEHLLIVMYTFQGAVFHIYEENYIIYRPKNELQLTKEVLSVWNNSSVRNIQLFR